MAAMIDYPRDRHQIQVLDDSTDITRAIVGRVVAELRAAGHWITVLHRSDRAGFKAGALQAGLQAAAGEFVAIFDADFVPPPEFLRQTVLFLQLDPGLGLVQGRWGHINPDESLLTRTQAIGIDGHFMIEQSARAYLFIYAVGFATMAVSGLRADFRRRRDRFDEEAAPALAA